MAELKIMPIVPLDEDDARATRKKRAPAAPRKPRARRAPAAAPCVEPEEVVDPSDPEFDPKAVEDEVKKRYGLDSKLNVVEVKRSRSGVKSHKTGATRR